MIIIGCVAYSWYILYLILIVHTVSHINTVFYVNSNGILYWFPFQVASIENVASEIRENATARSRLIRAQADATASATIENARRQGLELLYSRLAITEPKHKASFDYLRTIKNMEQVHLAVNYDSLWATTQGGSSRKKRSRKLRHGSGHLYQ